MKHFLRLIFQNLLALLLRPFVRRPTADRTSVLYIKPDHLGDLLLATPVLAALRAHLPRAHITALVGPWSRFVLARNPDIDALLICPFPGFERKKAEGRSKNVQAFFSAIHPYLLLLRYGMLLRVSRYDVAIIGRDDHWWGAALAMAAGIPRRVGYDVLECRPFLTHRLTWNPDDHVTVQGLALVEAITGAEVALTAPLARFDPAPEDVAWADAWLERHAITGQLVVIHPGTAGPTKLWLAERWAEVGDALSGGGEVRLLLTGGPDERALVEQVAGHMSSEVLSLVGQTTIGQLAALMQRASLVLGVDSGPLHLAAALGVPTIHLYGPGDANRFGPWGPAEHHHIVRSGVWCSPCGVFAACPRGLALPECMAQIETQQVIAAAENIFTAETQRARRK